MAISSIKPVRLVPSMRMRFRMHSPANADRFGGCFVYRPSPPTSCVYQNPQWNATEEQLAHINVYTFIHHGKLRLYAGNGRLVQ